MAIFTFLTTFRRASDAAGLTHGQAFPLLAFRLSGAAKRSFASAMNNTSAGKRYALKTYGDGVNWLLAKYATHDAVSSAYHNIIMLKQGASLGIGHANARNLSAQACAVINPRTMCKRLLKTTPSKTQLWLLPTSIGQRTSESGANGQDARHHALAPDKAVQGTHHSHP